jgi:hypothetical protein
MQSSLIGKIEKAKRYAQETERVTFRELSLKFRGENNVYDVTFKGGKWYCTCQFFSGWGRCSHTMAMEKILGDMLPPEALNTKFDTSTAIE